MNKLPIYRAVVNDNDESGMLTISLVDAPAVEVDFLYFDEDKKPLNFSVENEEERKVLGVVMTADTPIYRRDASGMEYYIVYDKQTIEKMTEKYLRQNRQNNVDLSHSFELEEGIYLNEIFIKNTGKGIAPTGFEEVKDGSLFAIFHIENDEVWSAIKEGTFKGFSLSGLFQTELVQFNKQNNDKTKMKLNKVKQILRSLLVEMGEVSTDKGILVWNGEEELAVGEAVKGMDADGNEVDVEDGEYTTEDKKVIVVKEGKVAEIKEVEEEAPVAEEEKPTEEEPKPIEGEEKPIEEEEKPTEEEDEKDLKIKELEDALAAKDAEIEELKAKIAELENEPAAKSAEQTFAETVVKEDNSPKGKMAKRGYRFQ
jgi:hypothetical protein